MVQPLVETAISFALNRVRVYFSDPMNALGTTGNYSIPGLVVTVATASSNRRFVDLTTTGMVAGTGYTVTVTSPPVVDDLAQTLSLVSASFVGNRAPLVLTTFDLRDSFPSTTPSSFDGDELDFSALSVVKLSAGQAVYELMQSNAPRYKMRARYIPGGGNFVWWTALQQPDFSGAQSGYPSVDLTDIVLEQRIQ